MNVEIGAEAALFPEKKYINGIAIAVRCHGINENPGQILITGIWWKGVALNRLQFKKIYTRLFL
jgi:hypothetical protein